VEVKKIDAQRPSAKARKKKKRPFGRVRAVGSENTPWKDDSRGKNNVY
jgi:hypothetical protein